MKTAQIKLSTIRDVQDFVGIATRFDGDLDLSSGRYIVDAKSIIGIFSLDLSKPLTFVVHDDGAKADELLDDVAKFRE